MWLFDRRICSTTSSRRNAFRRCARNTSRASSSTAWWTPRCTLKLIGRQFPPSQPRRSKISSASRTLRTTTHARKASMCPTWRTKIWSGSAAAIRRSWTTAPLQRMGLPPGMGPLPGMGPPPGREHRLKCSPRSPWRGRWSRGGRRRPSYDGCSGWYGCRSSPGIVHESPFTFAPPPRACVSNHFAPLRACVTNHFAPSFFISRLMGWVFYVVRLSCAAFGRRLKHLYRWHRYCIVVLIGIHCICIVLSC